MNTNVSVLLPAAGSGSRLGMGEKAFLQLQGRSLLEWNLKAFAWAAQVVVALPAGANIDLSLYPNAISVQGGSTRQHSVYNMLQAATQPWVMVHDVARPFVVPQAIERLQQAMAQGVQAATLAVPVADTLIYNQQGHYGHTLERSAHMLIQTPQLFSYELLKQAHSAQHQEATDDAQMVMALGVPVHLIEGDRRMFKVTYPADWHMAQALAAYGDLNAL